MRSQMRSPESSCDEIILAVEYAFLTVSEFWVYEVMINYLCDAIYLFVKSLFEK